MFSTLRASIEYLCGERDDAPAPVVGGLVWIPRCAFWVLAILLIYAFSGQSSKFIYIDF